MASSLGGSFLEVCRAGLSGWDRRYGRIFRGRWLDCFAVLRNEPRRGCGDFGLFGLQVFQLFECSVGLVAEALRASAG